MGRTYLSADRVAGFEVEFANLGRRNVDVIRTGQVVVVGRSKESIPVGQDFEHAFCEDVPFFFALGLQDLEDKVLFAKSAGARESRERAMRVNSVMFFSFSSAMVMITYGSLQREVTRKISRKTSENLRRILGESSPRGRAAEAA